MGPPEWPPRRRPRTLWSDLAGLWDRFRDLPIAAQVLGALVAIVLVVVLLSVLFGDGNGTNVAARSTTTVSSTLPPTTTTLPPLPEGDDGTVREVLDGDSFELTDGTKIRLIGIDAPDVETADCYSEEATAHLRSLLPANQNVRIVYDTTRTDRFGRTLAYVYRLPDGLFVNLALARDGYARQLTTPPNTRHADEIGAAVADARSAGRGLWQTCATTTTPAPRPATTAAPATAAPRATTTTTTEPPETTTTAISDTTAPSNTTTTAGGTTTTQ